jgi:hypothetical protein
MSDTTFRWVATLSDGTSAVEHSGEYTIIPGERKPWVRLCEFAAEHDLHLTSLRLDYGGLSVQMPCIDSFDRFGYNENYFPARFYSLSYHLEGEFDEMGQLTQTNFVDLTAHFDEFEVHYIQDVTKGWDSWIVVTQGHEPMMPSPRP